MNRLLKILLVLAVLAAAPKALAQCPGTECYVTAAGSGTDCTAGSPCALEYAVETKATDGDDVNVASGNYTMTDELSLASATIDLEGDATDRPVITFGANLTGIYRPKEGSTVSNLILVGQNSSTYYCMQVRPNSTTYTNVECRDWDYGISSNYADPATFNNLILRNVTNRGLFVENGSNPTVNYGYWHASGGVSNQSTGTIVLNNVTMVGRYSAVGCNASGGVCTLNNVIITGIADEDNNNYTLTAGTGTTMNINTSIIQGQGYRNGRVQTGAGTFNWDAFSLANQQTNPDLKYLGINDAILTFFDYDSNQVDEMIDGGVYHEGFEAAGKKATWFMDDQDQTAITDYDTEIQALVNGSVVQVASESISSSNQALTYAFTVTYSGAGANPRIVVSCTSDCGPTDTITLTAVTDSGTDVTCYTGKAQADKTIAQVITDIDGHADWAAAAPGVNFDDAYSYCLEETTTAITGADEEIPWNQARLWNEDVYNAMTIPEGYWSYNNTAYQWSQSQAGPAGAVTVLKTTNATIGFVEDATSFDLTSISDIYNVPGGVLTFTTWLGYAQDGSPAYSGLTDEQKEARIRAYARDVATNMRFHGKWWSWSLYASGATSDEIEWIATELALNGVRVYSFAEASAYIEANWTAAGDARTRSYTVTYSGELNNGSNAIDAGTDVGLTTDIVGNAIKGTPDIGAWEFQGAGSRKASGFLLFE